MRPNSRSLVLRDPAMAILMGILPFAVASSPPAGDDFGGESDFGAEFGGDDYGAEFGDDYGAEFGMHAEFGAAPPPMALQHRTPPAVMNALAQLPPSHPLHPSNHHHHHAAMARKHHTARREMLLEPNKGSSVKIERYSFTINESIVLGVGSALDMTGQPDTNIRPQRVVMNAPQPGFVTVSEIKVANVSVTVGVTEDAFTYSPLAQGVHLDMPTLSPANRATVLGDYTGFVPPGYVGGSSYLFTSTFQGPASIIA